MYPNQLTKKGGKRHPKNFSPLFSGGEIILRVHSLLMACLATVVHFAFISNMSPPRIPNFIVNSFLLRDLAEFYLRQKLSPSRHDYLPSKKIPKVIHYAWFGPASIPEPCQRCIDSWHKIHPDWEFKLWNDSNFPFELYPYAQEALAKKCWAFVSDVARLHALYNYGGIYLDTDVKIVNSFNDLLHLGCFFCFEGPTQIATSTIGAKQHHPFIKLLLDWYRFVHFREAYSHVANVRFISKITRFFYNIKLDGQQLSFADDVHIFPRTYFSPKNINGVYQVTHETKAIHLGTGMWW